MKGDKVTKVASHAWKLFYTEEFQDMLPLIRTRHKIPAHGITSDSDYLLWFLDYDDEKDELRHECDRLVKQHELHPNATTTLRTLILYDTNDYRPLQDLVEMEDSNNLSEVCELVWFPDQVTRWEKSDQAYVQLIIPEHASQDDVMKFLTQRWTKEIQTLFTLQRIIKGVGKLRSTGSSAYPHHVILDVMRLNRLPIEELRVIAPQGNYMYKSWAISAIIKQRHKVLIPRDSIDSVVRQYKKLLVRSRTERNS